MDAFATWQPCPECGETDRAKVIWTEHDLRDDPANDAWNMTAHYECASCKTSGDVLDIDIG